MRLLRLSLSFFLLPLCIVLADDSSKQLIISALQGAGLSSLSDTGIDTISSLLNSNSVSNFTLLAPNNAAFDTQQAQAQIQDNSTLTAIIKYHLLPGTFINSSSSSSTPTLDATIMPLVIVARTLLADAKYAHLEGGKSQVVVWSRNGTGEADVIYFLNQYPEITILNTTTVVLPPIPNGGSNRRTLLIATISGILDPPLSLSQILQSNNYNLTALDGFLSMVEAGEGVSIGSGGGNGGSGGSGHEGTNGTNSANGLNGADGADGANGSNSGSSVNGASIKQLLESTHGFTLFAPDNEALRAAGSTTLASLVNNQTALKALTGNHYVNGTSYYSPQLLSSSKPAFVSASGQTFTFNTNASGVYVNCGSGNGVGASARIIKTDIVVSNGVVHIIDKVLVNLDVDGTRAGDAYRSAVSSASAESTSTPTGPIGPIPTGASGSSDSPGSNGSGNGAQSVSSSPLSLSSLFEFGPGWWGVNKGLVRVGDGGWASLGWGVVVGGVLAGALGVGVVGL